MIRKKLAAVATSLTLVTLVACNNDDTAYQNGYQNNESNTLQTQNDNDTRGITRVNYNDNTANKDGNANHNSDYINQYAVRDNIDRALDRFFNNDKRRNQAANNNDTNMNISSAKTNMSSNNYPHTRAVLIQDARYKFVIVDPRQIPQQQLRVPIHQGPQNQQQLRIPAHQGTPSQGQGQGQGGTAPVRPQVPQQTPTTTQKQPQTGQGLSQAASRVVELTNEQRRKNGLPALQMDSALSNVAQKKSVDMQQNGYFSHTSPTYGSPFDMMRDFGVTYKTAGENIAQGQQTPEQVVQSWMNSEGHRKNILSPNFTHIGVGFEQTGNHWTQMFVGR